MPLRRPQNPARPHRLRRHLHRLQPRIRRRTRATRVESHRANAERPRRGGLPGTLRSPRREGRREGGRRGRRGSHPVGEFPFGPRARRRPRRPAALRRSMRSRVRARPDHVAVRSERADAGLSRRAVPTGAAPVRGVRVERRGYRSADDASAGGDARGQEQREQRADEELAPLARARAPDQARVLGEGAAAAAVPGAAQGAVRDRRVRRAVR
mmetsp:Transcript_4093/g.16769  ORF Transcript_4093/g.16769 Transcript_4093/m.16769 type:complete len:212 (-) Transcript_4093:1027-1662(-)